MNAALGSNVRCDVLGRAVRERTFERDTRRALKGQSGTRGAGRFVVSVMQIDPTPLSVGYRAGLIFRERERCARQASLADESQHNRDKPQVSQLGSSARARDLHRP
jgi:hypothetical protein